jgi:hypothetical protein
LCLHAARSVPLPQVRANSVVEWESGRVGRGGLPHIHGTPRLSPDLPLICASCGPLHALSPPCCISPTSAFSTDSEAADDTTPPRSWPLWPVHGQSEAGRPAGREAACHGSTSVTSLQMADSDSLLASLPALCWALPHLQHPAPPNPLSSPAFENTTRSWLLLLCTYDGVPMPGLLRVHPLASLQLLTLSPSGQDRSRPSRLSQSAPEHWLAMFFEGYPPGVIDISPHSKWCSFLKDEAPI